MRAISPEAKPHWGLTARRSSGTYRAASSTLATMSSGILERPVLRRHEPEHDLVVGQDVAERREVAGAIGVVLEQQPVEVGQTREDVLRDDLVAAGRGPHAAGGVAAAHVHRARDAGQALEDHVVELRVRDELVRHVVPVRLERRAVSRVDVPLRVVRRVDLDVVAAELDEPVDDVLARQAGDVLDEVVRCRVRVGRVVGMPEDPVPARGRDRVLGARVGVRLQERVLVADDVALDLEAPGDERLLRRQRRRVGRLACARLPEAAPAGLRVQELEAAHRRREERIVHHRDEGDPPASGGTRRP